LQLPRCGYKFLFGVTAPVECNSSPLGGSIMKRNAIVGICAALFALAPAAVHAQSPFDGTWVIDVSKAQMPSKPDVYVLQNGMYQCRSCVPPTNIKADGNFQKVTGDPYTDAMSVKVIDSHTVDEAFQKGGKTVSTTRFTVSADGRTALLAFTDDSNPAGGPVTGSVTMTRLAPGPPGSHAISGTWRESKVQNISQSALTFTVRTSGDSLSMTSGSGQSYTAKLGGPDAPYVGDPGITSVSLKRLGPNAIEETDKRNGQVISVSQMTVSQDGRSMTIVNSDKLQGDTSRYVAAKQ
jgi:hypothetical protein